jgi:lipoic acid synthetase
MGERCTRNCRFCAVATGNPEALEADEPERLAEAAAALSLDYVVVTSVTRDDLEDGGAAHFAATIAAVHRRLRGVPVEVLIPDFQGAQTPLEKVMEAGPAVLNHNVETVRRLQGEVRPQGDYQRSLGVLGRAGRIAPDIPRKSGMMVGLGETDEEIRETLEDLAAAGVEGVTIGQYLRPTRRHMPVDRYVHPDKMAKYGEWAREAGITCAASAPYVRSSYRAAEMCLAMRR